MGELNDIGYRILVVIRKEGAFVVLKEERLKRSLQIELRSLMFMKYAEIVAMWKSLQKHFRVAARLYGQPVCAW